MQSAILENPETTRCPQDHEDDGSYFSTPSNGEAPAQIMQSECFEFVKKRNAPDVVVIGRHGHILFVSHHGGSVLRLLEVQEQNTEEHDAQLRLTQILNRLRATVFSQMETDAAERDEDAPNAFFSFSGQTVSLRGQLLKGIAGTPDFLMILIEPLKRSIRTAALNQYALDFTPREQAVLHYVKKGFTN